MKVTLNTILAGICILIVLVILVGTGLVLGAQKDQEQGNFYPAEPVPTPEQQIQQAIQAQQDSNSSSTTENMENTDNFGVYKNLGEIRVSTMADQETQTTALIIVKPWFYYEEQDSTFQEELTSKRALFKDIFLQFFSNRTAAQLKAMGEGQVKTQLLESINKELVLDSISAIYFEEYLFFD